MESYRLKLVREVLTDWKQRSITKPRNVLPIRFANTLQYIRRQACKTQGVTNCGCYKDGDLDFELGTNPCADCKTPGISLNEFSLVVWGIKENEGTPKARQNKGDLEFEKENLRKWMNGRAHIPPADMQQVVAVAWKSRWISSGQLITMNNQIAEVEASSSVLRRFLKRLRERVSFRKDGVIKDSPQQLREEIQEELMKTQRVEDAWLASQWDVPEVVKSLLKNGQISQFDSLRDSFTTISPQRRI